MYETTGLIMKQLLTHVQEISWHEQYFCPDHPSDAKSWPLRLIRLLF